MEIQANRLGLVNASSIAGVVSGTNNELIAAPGENKKIGLLAWSWWNKTSNETTVTLKSTSKNPIDTYVNNSIGGGKTFIVPDGFMVLLDKDEALELDLSGANDHAYFILYIIVEDKYNKYS